MHCSRLSADASQWPIPIMETGVTQNFVNSLTFHSFRERFFLIVYHYISLILVILYCACACNYHTQRGK